MRRFEIRWENGKAYWFLLDQHGQDIARSFIGYQTADQCHLNMRGLANDFRHGAVHVYSPPDIRTPPPDPDALDVARAEAEGMIAPD